MTWDGSQEIIESILWRKITPGDFFNIERGEGVGPSGGGGQTYIDIPLGGNLTVQEFGRFVFGSPLSEDDQHWEQYEIEVATISAPSLRAPLIITPRRGQNRRYRIANQNRQATSNQRHPAWTAERGFPTAPDDVTGRDDPRLPDISYLKIFLARTLSGEYLGGYANARMMRAYGPKDFGLGVLFIPNAVAKADGILQMGAESQLTVRDLSLLLARPSDPRFAGTTDFPIAARVVRRSLTVKQPQRSKSPPPGTSPTVPRAPGEFTTVNAPRSIDAEDWVEKRLRELHPLEIVIRVGHTALEHRPFDDGDLPGADIVLRDCETSQPIRFVEVKSAIGSIPRSIRLTAAELARAKKCHSIGIPYDIWVVAFGDSLHTHVALNNFQIDACDLNIDDLVTVEFQIALQ